MKLKKPTPRPQNPPRPHHPSKRETPPRETAAPRRWGVIALWMILFAVVIVAINNLLPIGRGMGLRGMRREKKLLESARMMNADELWNAAADVYEGLAGDANASAKTRAESAERLYELYTNNIPDPEKARRSLEKAIFYEKDETKREASRRKLEELRSAASASEAPAPPAGTSVVATIGSDTVTLEEILYGWKRLHPKDEPKGEAMEKYVQDFMTNALLAEGARQRKFNESPGHRLDMRLFARQMLSRDMLVSIAPKPDREAVRKFYEGHIQDYLKPDAISLKHIVVRSREEASGVGNRIGGGENFDAIAKETSLDRNELPDGSQLDWIARGDDFIPHAGVIPSLVEKLFESADGATTGPIETARGFHWFKVAAKRTNEPVPFDEVFEKVEARCRKELFKTAEDKLIEELRKTISVTMHEDVLKNALKSTGPKTASRDAATSATAATDAGRDIPPESP